MCRFSDEFAFTQAQCTSVYKKQSPPKTGCTEETENIQTATEKQAEANYRVQNLSLQSVSEQRLSWSRFKETYSLKLLSKTNMVIKVRHS